MKYTEGRKLKVPDGSIYVIISKRKIWTAEKRARDNYRKTRVTEHRRR